jgi:hypothetical protein
MCIYGIIYIAVVLYRRYIPTDYYCKWPFLIHSHYNIVYGFGSMEIRSTAGYRPGTLNIHRSLPSPYMHLLQVRTVTRHTLHADFYQFIYSVHEAWDLSN